MPTNFQLNPILAKLPFYFTRWWYYEAPPKLFTYLTRILWRIAHLLSVELLLKTFFEPWRKEYRKGFVAVARFVGISVKAIFLFFDLFILGAILIWSVFIFVSWFLLPLTPFLALFLFFKSI